MLGVTVRFDTFEKAEEHLVHVVEVLANSPAAEAGLIVNEDYVLGTAEICFYDCDDFFEEVSLHENQHLMIYVYNVLRDEVRQVELRPRSWAGDGILGPSLSHPLPLRSVSSHDSTAPPFSFRSRRCTRALACATQVVQGHAWQHGGMRRRCRQCANVNCWQRGRSRTSFTRSTSRCEVASQLHCTPITYCRPSMPSFYAVLLWRP
jgi:hypothetical protein